MSFQATSWAIEQDIVAHPADRHVLLALSNSADHAGRNAFPSVRTLARATGYSERAVQKILRRLEAAGAIRLGDQRIAEVQIARQDRRPTVYDLAMPSAPKLGERGEPRSPRSGLAALANGVNGKAERGERRDTNGVNGGSPDHPLRKSLNARARGEGPVENPSPRRAGDRTATAPTGAPDRGFDRERGGLAAPGAEAGEGPDDGAACGVLAEPLQPDHPDFAAAALPDDPAAAAALRRKIVFRQRQLVLAWLLGAQTLDRFDFLPVLRRSLHSRAEVEAAALAVPGRARRIAQSWVRWARAIARGDPHPNDPHPDVSRLAALLAGPHAAFFAARCARLMGEDGAGEDGNREPGTGGSAAAAPSSCRDPPAGGA